VFVEHRPREPQMLTVTESFVAERTLDVAHPHSLAPNVSAQA
jgi:hypothetical protein